MSVRWLWGRKGRLSSGASDVIRSEGPRARLVDPGGLEPLTPTELKVMPNPRTPQDILGRSCLQSVTDIPGYELRSALNAARAAIGLAAWVYTDSITPGTVIKAIGRL